MINKKSEQSQNQLCPFADFTPYTDPYEKIISYPLSLVVFCLQASPSFYHGAAYEPRDRGKAL